MLMLCGDGQFLFTLNDEGHQLLASLNCEMVSRKTKCALLGKKEVSEQLGMLHI